jgi:hypothetical protein
VSPVYCGENARDSALSYARQPAGYGRAEIQVLDEALECCRDDRQRRGAASGVKSCQFKTLPTIAPDTLALRRMFRFHFRDGHFPSAEQIRSHNFNHCVLIVTASAVYFTIKIRGMAGA